jgi:nitrogen fixation NifU-like protein
MTSVLAKGKTLEQALILNEEDIVKALDGLPESKQHCSNLGIGALRNAIENYKNKIIESEDKKDENSNSRRG